MTNPQIPQRVQITIPMLASEWGMSRRTAYDWLRGLREKDLASKRRRCDWWLQGGPLSPVRINVSLLKRQHAAEFQCSLASQEDLEALEDRVEELEEALERMSARQRLADRGDRPLRLIEGRESPRERAPQHGVSVPAPRR